MDPHRFYGGIHTTIQNFPDNSSDEELSDDEHEVNKNLPPLNIPESDKSDWELEDNIPLSQMIPPSSRSARAEKPRWWDEFLGKGDHETAFTGDTTLPEGRRSLDTPVQFYKYLFTDEMFKYIEQETILTVPREEYMAVDEQIIPTKSRSSMRQYNPKKPHKWGYTNFVLSGSSGFSYDFELYTGAQGHVQLVTDLPKISTSSDVVVRLARTIPDGFNYKLFFDNWYTSLPLLTYLAKKAILPLGTIKANRIPGYKVPTEKELKKKGRGATVEKLVTIDNLDISVVTWFDNRIVNLASTYVISKPSSEVQRFNKKEKSYQTVSCPKAVITYNRHMGGVDLLNDLLGYYGLQIR